MNVLIIIGSLREGSLNAKLAANFGRILHEKHGAKVDFADIDLPIFDADKYDQPSEKVRTLRKKIARAGLIFVVSPEYNRSFSGGTKNALDWVSWRVNNFLAGKKVVVAGASLGSLGTALAQYDLKKVLTASGADVFAKSEFMFGDAAEKFGAEDLFADENDEKIAEKFLADVAEFAEK